MRKRVSDWPAWINRRKFERIMKEKLNIQVRAAGLEEIYGLKWYRTYEKILEEI